MMVNCGPANFKTWLSTILHQNIRYRRIEVSSIKGILNTFCFVFQEKNSRRKQRRISKQLSMMRPTRAGTPLPDLPPSPERKVNPGKVLTDKNSSIVVDLSNYRPFTTPVPGDEPFLVISISLFKNF